jgi:hypothetical protein
LSCHLDRLDKRLQLNHLSHRRWHHLRTTP